MLLLVILPLTACSDPEVVSNAKAVIEQADDNLHQAALMRSRGETNNAAAAYQAIMNEVVAVQKPLIQWDGDKSQKSSLKFKLSEVYQKAYTQLEALNGPTHHAKSSTQRAFNHKNALASLAGQLSKLEPTTSDIITLYRNARGSCNTIADYAINEFERDTNLDKMLKHVKAQHAPSPDSAEWKFAFKVLLGQYDSAAQMFPIEQIKFRHLSTVNNGTFSIQSSNFARSGGDCGYAPNVRQTLVSLGHPRNFSAFMYFTVQTQNINNLVGQSLKIDEGTAKRIVEQLTYLKLHTGRELYAVATLDQPNWRKFQMSGQKNNPESSGYPYALGSANIKRIDFYIYDKKRRIENHFMSGQFNGGMVEGTIPKTPPIHTITVR